MDNKIPNNQQDKKVKVNLPEEKKTTGAEIQSSQKLKFESYVD